MYTFEALWAEMRRGKWMKVPKHLGRRIEWCVIFVYFCSNFE